MKYSTCGVLSYETVMQDLRDNLNTRFAAILPYGERMAVTKDEGVVVGWCGLKLGEALGAKAPEVTYSILPPHRGHGYATECAMAMRNHAFRELGACQLIALIHPENSPSIRVARRIGLRCVGEPETSHLYSMTRAMFVEATAGTT